MDTSKIIPYGRHCEERKRRGNPAFPAFLDHHASLRGLVMRLDVGVTYIKSPSEGNRLHEPF